MALFFAHSTIRVPLALAAQRERKKDVRILLMFIHSCFDNYQCMFMCMYTIFPVVIMIIFPREGGVSGITYIYYILCSLRYVAAAMIISATYSTARQQHERHALFHEGLSIKRLLPLN